MTQRFTPHTVSLIIAAVSKEKQWHGTRRGLTVTLKLDPQTDIQGNRVKWTAYPAGHYARAKRGRASTVFAALAEIEASMRAQLASIEEPAR